MTLGKALSSGQTGNLDTLRLLLAGCVVVSHAWPLALGPGTHEPFVILTGHSLGGWAVGLFFFLSGLLVTASAERRSDLEFWTARICRIVPGLGAALFTTLALAYASGSTATQAEAASWFARALTLFSIEHRISGAFATNPYPEVVNGPLWSLSHEVMAYALCYLFVRAGGTRHPCAFLLLIVAAILGTIFADDLPRRVATFAPLFLCFVLGATAYVFRERILLKPVAALVVFPLVAWLSFPIGVALLAYTCVAIALVTPEGKISGDYSYGIYIYGWPVAQMVVHLQPGIGPVALAAASLAATAPFAVVSWHLVERPVIFRAPARV